MSEQTPDLPDGADDVPDTPQTDPDATKEKQATGEDQARQNREQEPPA